MRRREATAVPTPVRALAAVVALLCALGVLAPITARAKGAEHSHVQTVKVVNNAGADQYASVLRIDQPQLVAHAPAPAHGRGYSETAAAATQLVTMTTPETARTRGPPV